MRTGIGYDIHKLVAGRKLMLGGVHIPGPQGLLGHSDADAVLHALCDALLGAAGLGDIGEHFPDTDPQYSGIDSAVLLERTRQSVRQAGWSIGNVDIIIFAQTIKLMLWKPQIRQRLAELLQVDQRQVNIKAKTMEQLDAVGRGEAIAATCAVLLAPQRRGAKGKKL